MTFISMTFPSTLLDRLASRRLIPFVGAGISRSVLSATERKPLFPSWRELLESAADKLKEENKENYATDRH